MLLSRLTVVHPNGAVIGSLPDRRAVTTATMTSPVSAAGLVIVSEVALETLAVELPWRTIEPSMVAGGRRIFDFANALTVLYADAFVCSRAPAAGEARAPESTPAASKVRQAASVAGRGRLPNMFHESARRQFVKETFPSNCVPRRDDDSCRSSVGS